MNQDPSEETIYWYLTSPCGGHVHGLEAAFRDASKAVRLLEEAKIPVYSPVVHGSIAAAVSEFLRDPLDLTIWMFVEQPVVDDACGLIVLMLEGWDKSFGIKHEIDTFEKAGKPVIYMTPGEVPLVDTP